MGSKDVDDSINVLGGTAFQSDLVVFPTPYQVCRSSQFVITASDYAPSIGVYCPSSVKCQNPVIGISNTRFLLQPALTSKLSEGPPRPRRDAENGSNRDSSEAARSGFGGPKRPGERCYHINRFCFVSTGPIPTRCSQSANSFSGVNVTSFFMMQ